MNAQLHPQEGDQPSGRPDNAELIERYKRHKRPEWPSQATRKQRALVLRLISRAIPDMIDATAEDLGDWRDSLDGLSVHTRAAYVSVCKGFYEWLALDARLRSDNPAARLRGPKVPKTRPRPMLPRHYTQALASAAVVDIEMYLWLLLAGCCGFRCCEIAWLKVGDIEELPDGSSLAHILGKGGKRRTVPIGAGLMATMRPFLTGRGSVFTRPSDGKAHTPHNVSGRINRFLHELGIGETAHQLRHRFGTDYHVVDPDVFRQAEIMGHESVNQTRGYTQIAAADAAKVIETLTRRWMGQGPAAAA